MTLFLNVKAQTPCSFALCTTAGPPLTTYHLCYPAVINSTMTTTVGDVEEQRKPSSSPGRPRGGGLNKTMQGESVNFSAYLSAQRNLSSQRFLVHRRASNIQETIPEEEPYEVPSKSSRGLRASRQLRHLESDEWADIFDNLGDIDENGHFHDSHSHLNPFYSPPVQRQRWGEDQVLPHVNWGEFLVAVYGELYAVN